MKTSTSQFALMLMLLGLLVTACGGEGATTTTEPAAAGSSTTEEMMDDETTTTEMMDDEMGDVLAVAEGEGDLGIFLAALDAAGIMDDFHGDGPFTLFIPTDEAFAAYLDQAGMSQEEAFAGAEMLQSILGHHIIDTLEDSEMVMGMGGESFTTISGAPLEVTVDDDTVMVGDATIVRYDIQASNGVIHVIDTVLTPPAG